MAQTDETENVSEVHRTYATPQPFKITVELCLFLPMMAMALTGAASSNLVFYRTCVHALHHSTDECSVFLRPNKINLTQSLEEEVQKYATIITMIRTILESLGPAVLAFFVGVWSDTHGRKPLIVWPLFGMALASMLEVVYSCLDNLGPWWYILTKIPFMFSGGYNTLFTGSFCYINDISTPDSKSFRMTLLEVMFSVGSVIGGILSSYILRAVGMINLFLIAAGLFVLAYSYANIFIEESLSNTRNGSLRTLMDFDLVKEMIKTCFKKRENDGRKQLFLLTFSNTLSIFVMFGMMSLEYMYVREKLHWALQEYTLFSAVGTMISVTGACTGVVVIQRMFGLADVTMAIMGYLSAFSEYMTKAFAGTTWHMYFGISIGCLKGLSAPLIRSSLSKMIPSQDIAKVYALMSSIESLAPLLAPLVFSTLYTITLTTFPGAIYLLSCSVFIVCITLCGFVYHYKTRRSSVYEPLLDPTS